MELREYLQETTLATAGYRRLVSVEPGASISQAIDRMSTERVGCLLVIEGTSLCGIFTERDVVTRVLGKGQSLETPVSKVMTLKPTTASVEERLSKVFGKMQAGGFRHLPVVKESGEPLGTVSVKRVVGCIADHFFQAVYNVPPEPHQYPKAPEGG